MFCIRVKHFPARKQMKYFVECIKTRQQPSPGIIEGQIVLDIVDAAYKSSQTGEVVNF